MVQINTHHHINFVMDHKFCRHLDPTKNNSKQPPMGRGHNGKHPSGNIRRCLFDGFWLGHVGSNGICISISG